MNLGGLFDLDALEEKIAENEARMAEQGFWDDQEKAQEVIAENNDLKAKFETFHELIHDVVRQNNDNPKRVKYKNSK